MLGSAERITGSFAPCELAELAGLVELELAFAQFGFVVLLAIAEATPEAQLYYAP